MMKKQILAILMTSLLLTFGCKNETKTRNDNIKLKDNANSSNSKTAFVSDFGDQPTIAKSSDNLIGVSFGKEESIYYAESNDNGDSFNLKNSSQLAAGFS